MGEGAPNSGHEAAAISCSTAAVVAPQATVKSRRTRWNNDGPNNSVSSLSVFLDWLIAHGNYDRWRGGDKLSGETKAVLASQIAAHTRDKGITTVRKPKDIISKIGQLEQSYWEAVDFLRNTGSGITDEATLKEAVEKRCPHYYVLKDVLDDRPSSRPLATNEDIFSNDDAGEGDGNVSAIVEEAE